MDRQITTKLPNTPAGISRASDLLNSGQLVAFATETVYGLGADARNDTAVAQIFSAKGRPQFNPLIVHVASLAAAQKLAAFSPQALALATAFWPGPLTLVLPLLPDSPISPRVSAGLPTLALRVPAHPMAHDLLTEFDGPIAAPSANISGKISPTSPDHVLDGLSGHIAAVLDAGPCPVGLESTIIGFDPVPTLLRPGGLPAEIIENCISQPLAAPPTQQPMPNAPGQLASHYAPTAKIRLNADQARPDEVLLGFGAVPCDLNLSPSADLAQAAANLFRHLHALDANGAKIIAVSAIPDTGLGRAINDRLKRAAAPRD
ncbi:MAG: L-threonylcarbamoyladenylate synthase [Paracoccaceae bacterium]